MPHIGVMGDDQPQSHVELLAEARERQAAAYARLRELHQLKVRTIARAEYLKLRRALYSREG